MCVNRAPVEMPPRATSVAVQETAAVVGVVTTKCGSLDDKCTRLAETRLAQNTLNYIGIA